MKYNPTKHHRRSIRLKGYDYHNAGAYFVTICTKNRECVLDDPIVTEIIIAVWQALPQWFPTIELDEFVIMPNHVHFVVWIVERIGTSLADVPVADVLDGNEKDNNVGIPLAGIPVVDVMDGHKKDGGNPDGGNPDGGEPRPYVPQPQKINLKPALGDIVGAFKSLVFTVYLDWIEKNDPSRRAKFWQGNYYEHIIRNDRELNAIRQYIIDNPINWETDRDNLENIHHLPPPENAEDYLQEMRQLMGWE